jgi:hypothetical protein
MPRSSEWSCVSILVIGTEDVGRWNTGILFVKNMFSTKLVCEGYSLTVSVLPVSGCVVQPTLKLLTL